MINIIKAIKTFIGINISKSCNHKLNISKTYAIKKKIKCNGRYVKRYDVYEEYICTKCGYIIKMIIDHNCTAHRVINFYGLDIKVTNEKNKSNYE